MTRCDLTRTRSARTFALWVLSALALPVAACGDDDAAAPPDSGLPAVGMDGGQPPASDSGQAPVVDAEGPVVVEDAGRDSAAADDEDGSVPVEVSCDADDDGFDGPQCGGADCDDTRAAVSPGAPEICDNGIDDDCDPTTGDLADNDHDRARCDVDCDDADPNVGPQRAERCGNGIDDDCDPTTPDVFDADGDGASCDVDCDDDDATVAPGTAELCLNGVDDDCDPATPDRNDADGDGVPCDVDCDDASATVPDIAAFCGAVLDYYEGFEAGAGGWTPDASSVWHRGMPAGDRLDTAAAGSFTLLAQDPDSGEYLPGELSTVTSARFDMSGLTDDPVIAFQLRYFLSSGDYVWLEMSVDGGSTWATVTSSPLASNWYAAGSLWTGQQSEWVGAQTVLTGAAGQADVRLRFVISTSPGGQDDGFAIDELRIRSQVVDASLTLTGGSRDGCGSRDAVSVTVQLANRGNGPLSDVPVFYSVDGGAAVSEVVPGPIAVGAATSFTFAVPADFSSVGLHALRVWHETAGDGVPDGDEATAEVRTYPVASLDYASSFEADGGGWMPSGARSSWERGEPAGDQIVGASDGSFAWVTNASGVTNHAENSFLSSPCFDMSAASVDPVLLLDFAMASAGHSVIEVSLDGGASFQRLGSQGSGTGWYNTTDGWSYDPTYAMAQPWRQARHPVTGGAGQALVQLRVHFQAYSFEAGFAVDNVRVIGGLTEAEVTAVEVPDLVCSDQVATTVRATVRNNGNLPLTGFDLSYQLDGGTTVQETASLTLQPGESGSYDFTTPLDASTVGDHVLQVRVLANGDLEPANDAMDAPLTTRPRVSAVGYVEGFEADDGDWLPTGLDGQWQWGTPNSPQLDTITRAGEGDKLWTTRLNGQYLIDGEAALVSPCLDFSGYSAEPSIRFLHANDTYDGTTTTWTQLDVSTDGRTWTRVGSDVSGGQNWYNFMSSSQSRAGWRGQWDWRVAQHPLAGVAGEPHVFVRYDFTASTSLNNEYDGVGVDLVQIASAFIDLAVSDLQVGAEGCAGARDAEAFSIEVTNNSTVDVSAFTLTYAVDSGAPVDVPVTQTIAAGASYQHAFGSVLDLDALGDHTVQVMVSVTGADVDATNDVVSVDTTTLPVLAGAYAQDFDSDDGGWSAGGVSSTWEHGTPSAGNTVLVPATASGSIWATNLGGDYDNNELSYLTSPCFDFSAETGDPSLGFRMAYELESSWDGVYVELTVDGGASWLPLGSAADTGWYSNASKQWWDGTNAIWTLYQHALDGAAGSPATRVRFVVDSDGSSVREGPGIDDVSITVGL